ncbi:heavy-metal-associated domain-containing protein [Pseudomonas sp. EL_65y_Pfl1_R32]|uniref:heavy-metal-associated domain-containing protein n=1 Tax=Pseudomonas sp. EL_65y_Pfl1_R32 TaxID=3088696 RepID=UPI0030DBC3B5
MTTFEVQDMTCGHCVRIITDVVLALDPAASVQVDLPSHLVQIESASVEAPELADAIVQAGYSPIAPHYQPGDDQEERGLLLRHLRHASTDFQASPHAPLPPLRRRVVQSDLLDG